MYMGSFVRSPCIIYIYIYIYINIHLFIYLFIYSYIIIFSIYMTPPLSILKVSPVSILSIEYAMRCDTAAPPQFEQAPFWRNEFVWGWLCCGKLKFKLYVLREPFVFLVLCWFWVVLCGSWGANGRTCRSEWWAGARMHKGERVEYVFGTFRRRVRSLVPFWRPLDFEGVPKSTFTGIKF